LVLEIRADEGAERTSKSTEPRAPPLKSMLELRAELTRRILVHVHECYR
jgi:hypothetical protein